MKNRQCVHLREPSDESIELSQGDVDYAGPYLFLDKIITVTKKKNHTKYNNTTL